MIDRFLNAVERLGNRLPDPALLFVLALLCVWVASSLLAGADLPVVDPRTGAPVVVVDQLQGKVLVSFLARAVEIFVQFPPLGVVLVTLLGVGVAEKAGLVSAAIKAVLSVTPRRLLTPTLVLVALLSHTTADAGFVLVIPLGGVIFHAAGRHPLAGIAAAFAGVSGGFSATFLPTPLDPLLQGFTQSAARILDPSVQVNVLCNLAFTSASSLLVVLLGWFVTDRIVEPRLMRVPVDGDDVHALRFDPLSAREGRALLAAAAVFLAGVLAVTLAAMPQTSPLRSEQGELTSFTAPLMRAIVPLLFLLFLVPGVVYGALAGSIKSHKDVVDAMAKTMGTMGYYLVLAFFAALFTEAFKQSNLGALVALSGAAALKALAVAPAVTIVGIILLTGAVNLLVGSASAKWALLSPIFVPMLMQLGLSPELTQAAYRVGDSTTNIVTPLMPYFPLVVVYCQRFTKGAGIGTLVSMMLPFSAILLSAWSAFLLLWWALGLPLGLQASYTYP